MDDVVQTITFKKEVMMPQHDKTGPEGKGPMTGRKLGACAGNNTETTKETRGRGMRFVHGKGKGLGLGRRLGRNTNSTQ